MPLSLGKNSPLFIVFFTIACLPMGPIDRGMHPRYWGMGPLMWIWWVLIILAIGVLIWLVATTSYRSRRPSGENAEQVLKRRYAKGEIDRETYERMLIDLRK